MNLKFLFLFTILLNYSFVGFCQSNYNVPKIIPTTPEVAAFARYGDIPVGHTTGVPSIQVPIYVLKAGNLQLPIDISYHASGIKVQDVPSIVGLGWVINTGGVISRTVLGTLDEDFPKYFRSSSEIDAYKASNANINVIEKLEQIENGMFDTQSDRFVYNFNGQSGVFRYDFVTDEVNTIPYTPIKIEKSLLTAFGHSSITGFTITTMDGAQYVFDVPVMTDVIKTGWHIGKIISADKTDTISFHYSDGENISERRYSQVFTLGWHSDWRIDCNWYEPFPTCDCAVPNDGVRISYSKNPSISYSTTMKLDSITSSTTRIIFEYLNDRQDRRLTRLKKVSIKNERGDFVKTVSFNHSYFGSSPEKNLRLRLDSLEELDKNDSAVGKYQFIYNTDVILPPYIQDINWEDQFYEDYWGYYNGTTNLSLIPEEYAVSHFNYYDIANADIPTANRNPDPNYMQACILKKIIYPTKGETLFEFESNVVPNTDMYDYPNDNNGVVGGLRIKTIKSYSSADDLPIVKSFSYDRIGEYKTILERKFYYEQPQHYIFQVGGCLPEEGLGEDHIYLANSALPVTYMDVSPVVYDKITEYEGTESVNAGKTIYEYSNIYHTNHFWEYSNVGDLQVKPQFEGVYSWDWGDYNPLLIHKSTYKRNGLQYKLLEEIENSYININQKEFNTGYAFDRSVQNIPVADRVAKYTDEYQYINEFKYVDTKAFVDVPVLANSLKRIFDDNEQSITTATSFEYDTITLLPAITTTRNSKAEVITTKYIYPHDAQSTTIPNVYNQLVNRHIWSPVIEQSVFKDTSTVPLQSTRMNYNYWKNNAWGDNTSNLIVPQTVESKTQYQASYETRLRYHSYDDNGNIVAVSKENDVKKSYIWGYNKSLPIAEAVHAESKDIFYTSFEEGDGNSAVADCKMGDKSKTNGFTKSLSNLSNGNYLLTYWKKSNGNWTFQRSDTSVSNNTFNINISGQIDEVRFYPSDAVMTTYNYYPLIGITSQCDINNRITYYEHDSFGRLSIVRDQDKKILKKFCYNYSGQPEGCTVPVYYNVVKSGFFTKQGCSLGFQGSVETYTVDDSTYMSYISQEDADQQAQNDVDANGQSYANTHGSCNLVPICVKCFGNDRKCIDDNCEIGQRINTASYYDSGTNQTVCIYHYEWSDGSWSIDYYQYTPGMGILCVAS